MKNTLLTILSFISLILFSCGPSVKEKAKIEKEILDSIKKADSLANVFNLDSLKKDSITKASTIQKKTQINEKKNIEIKTNVEVTDNKFGTFKDTRDGKIYKTIKIGTQTWMAENLAYEASSGCWAYKDNQSNVAIYGYLYNWETAKNVCPSGWHLPSDEEWTILIDYLGGMFAGVGGKLKSTTGWKSPNTGATNISGFTALPGGKRSGTGSTVVSGRFIGLYGYWWSSTEYRDSGLSWSVAYDDKTVGKSYDFGGKRLGVSVRCVKD